MSESQAKSDIIPVFSPKASIATDCGNRMGGAGGASEGGGVGVGAGLFDGRLGGGPADCQPVDPQGRLTDPDRHTLAFLAAGADATVQRQVVGDHRYLGQ
jgi:hypothetical protein